jgi:hypothetical protein
VKPTSVPSLEPSSSPSLQPSSAPSSAPSSVPSRQPSSAPTPEPSSSASTVPSSEPSATPSIEPSSSPSSSPSLQPSLEPSSAPSAPHRVSRAWLFRQSLLVSLQKDPVQTLQPRLLVLRRLNRLQYRRWNHPVVVLSSRALRRRAHRLQSRNLRCRRNPLAESLPVPLQKHQAPSHPQVQ